MKVGIGEMNGKKGSNIFLSGNEIICQHPRKFHFVKSEAWWSILKCLFFIWLHFSPLNSLHSEIFCSQINVNLKVYQYVRFQTNLRGVDIDVFFVLSEQQIFQSLFAELNTLLCSYPADQLCIFIKDLVDTGWVQMVLQGYSWKHNRAWTEAFLTSRDFYNPGTMFVKFIKFWCF